LFWLSKKTANSTSLNAISGKSENWAVTGIIKGKNWGKDRPIEE
jgi:hypothetical protein